MVDPLKGCELLRLSVRWPLTIKTGNEEAHGETRNITGEGMFLSCSERLHEGIVYPMTIKLPEKRVEMTGKVTWSNLNNCTSLNLNSAMGFYFMRIDGDEGRQSLRAAIVAECRKPLRMRQGADQIADSFPSNKTQVSASFGDSREY
jgi:hypothetical protein